MSCDCGGNTALGQWGARVGAQLGDRTTAYGSEMLGLARKKFKDWTGLGDYNLVGNSLIAGKNDPGLNIETSGRFTRIRYREYLGEVFTHPTYSGAFNITHYRLNPADPRTFPWLSPIALQYEQYKPMGILFEFRSTATTSSNATAALGSIIMSTDYNVLDPAYTSKSEMLNAAYSQEARVSNDQIHGIECDPRELQQNVYFSSLVLPTTNQRDYDIGNFYVATDGGGLPANQSVGSLYVHYDFMFMKEQLVGGLLANHTIWTEYQVSGVGKEFQDAFGNTIDPNSPAYKKNVWGFDTGITCRDNGLGFITWALPALFNGTIVRLELFAETDGSSAALGKPVFGSPNSCILIREPSGWTASDSAFSFQFPSSTVSNQRSYWRGDYKMISQGSVGTTITVANPLTAWGGGERRIIVRFTVIGADQTKVPFIG